MLFLRVLGVLACLIGSVGCVPEGASSNAEAGGAVGLPAGTVVAFAGREIPVGWTLCDGSYTSSGLVTPDLRDRFLMGSDQVGKAPVFGGSPAHAHTGTVNQSEGPNTGVDSGDNRWVPSQKHKHTLTIMESEHLPPYAKLVFIMKD